MVQQVTVPLAWANVIPGVAGVEDAEFDVPTLEDIVGAVVENTLDRTDLDESLGSFVDDVADQIDQAALDVDALSDQLVDAVEERVAEIVIDAETVADAVVSQLNLEDLVTDQVNISGIFGPLTEDVVRAFEQILAEVLGAIDDLPEDFDSITQAIDQVILDTEEILARLPADIQSTVEDGVETVLEETGLDEFLDDPIGVLLDAVEQRIRNRLDPETIDLIETRETYDPPD